MKTAETDGTIIEFLLGSHPYDGVWFGDQHPEKEGWFWWRKALRDYASHPSPMSAEPTVQQLRDVSKNNPDTFIAGALYVIDNYKLNSPPMSAEQVEVLHAIMVLAEHGIPGYAFGDNEAACEMDNRLSEICRLAATTPSVKADGWVSVEDGLPEVGEYVLVSLENGYTELIGRLLNDKVWVAMFLDGEKTANINLVTHWQPLPAPPKQQL